jgi:hypothetical protein
MKTISACVQELLIQQPFLEEAISRRIINYSALAEELQPSISKMLRKEVKSGAIMMALRRYEPPTYLAGGKALKKGLRDLGDITVRSQLVDFTFQNSETLIHSHTRLLEEINQKSFYAFSRGIYESNIVVSEPEISLIEDTFKQELLLGREVALSAISMRLPDNNSEIPGLYYHFFKRFAWEGIAVYEVISTTNEFTVLVKDHIVDQAFSIIKNLKLETKAS